VEKIFSDELIDFIDDIYWLTNDGEILPGSHIFRSVFLITFEDIKWNPSEWSLVGSSDEFDCISLKLNKYRN